jgi:hypothetical protein
MYMNGTLTNSEIWYNVSKSNIETLESKDLMLIRKLIKGHLKTANEAFFPETETDVFMVLTPYQY